MKNPILKSIILLLVAANLSLLASCVSAPDQSSSSNVNLLPPKNNETETADATQDADASQDIDTVRDAEAVDTVDVDELQESKPMLIQSHIVADAFYKDHESHDLVAMINYDISWPYIFEHYDIDPLQTRIVEYCFGLDAGGFYLLDFARAIKVFKTNSLNISDDNEGKIVIIEDGDTVIEYINDYVIDNDSIDDVSEYLWSGAPMERIDVEFFDFDADKGVLTYQIVVWGYTGTAGDRYYFEDYACYDINNSKVIEIDDVLNPEAKNIVLQEINSRCEEAADDYSPYHYDEMPRSFFIDDNLLIIPYMAFYKTLDKVAIDVEADKELLTPYGLKLFGLE